MTIRDYGRLRATAGDVGVEIEVEGQSLPGNRQGTAGFTRFWSVHHDGSLRGESFEYVLKKPLDLEGVRLALDEVAKSYKKCHSIIHDSVRAGVHIHINCQRLNMRQVMTFATLYFTLEELLLMFCTPSRRGNHFCLRASDAEFQMYQLQQVIESRSLTNFNNPNVRYSSLNFCALPKFGSLEFRSLESGDLDKIHLWATILLRLREVSLEYDDPISVVESMSQDGCENFLSHVLGDTYKHFSGITSPDGLILSGIRHAQDLAYGTDWETVERNWGVGIGRDEGYPPPPPPDPEAPRTAAVNTVEQDGEVTIDIETVRAAALRRR